MAESIGKSEEFLKNIKSSDPDFKKFRAMFKRLTGGKKKGTTGDRPKQAQNE